jgi:hypothetical protein
VGEGLLGLLGWLVGLGVFMGGEGGFGGFLFLFVGDCLFTILGDYICF